MVLKNSTFKEFSLRVRKKNNLLVFFGAGTLLTSWVSYLIGEYDLEEYILGCVDNDPAKQDRDVVVGNRRIHVYPREWLRSQNPGQIIVLITSSYFAAIIEQLDGMEELERTECYVAPVMYITHKKAKGKNPGKNGAMLIPKVIHYCWFGGKQIPERNLACIESWKQYCPDYEIIEWNEGNYDIHKNLYMEQAYQAGKWGFVPDYARVDLLYEYGGIYFDTDVELLRNLDELLYQEAFTSFEEYPTVNIGGGSGSRPGFPLFKKIRDYRENKPFIREDGSYDLKTCGYYETNPLIEAGLRPDGSLQSVQGLTVYPSDYFHVKSSVTGRIERTENTYGIHRFNWSWAGEEQMEDKRRTHSSYEGILERIKREADYESD